MKRIPRIGYLASSVTDKLTQPLRDSFQDGLRDHGYVIGESVAIEWRSTEGDDARFEPFVTEFVKMPVDVMVSSSPIAHELAKRATRTVPIVMLYGADPIESGLIQSMARPGVNVTGMSVLSSSVMNKQLELLKDAFPDIRRVAILTTDDAPAQRLFAAADDAARNIGVEIVRLPLHDESDLPRLLAEATRQRADALVIPPTSFIVVKLRSEIVAYAAGRKIPALYITGFGFVESGGLIGFGPNVPACFRRAADFVDRIFKGANAADMPVEQPTQFDLVINLRTARELGLTIPAGVLSRATSVVN